MMTRLRTMNWQETVAVFLACFALAVFLQYRGGAYECEFGGHPDEAAHYVTGLMIRDYIAGGFPGSPMTYAKDYYDHYPKVALGNWPPGFYLLQSAWTLVFSPSRTAVVTLMAFLAASVSLLLFGVLKKPFGLAAAWLGALLFVSFPLTQRHTAMIMTEVPIALFVLVSLIFFTRFLRTEKTADSVWFGLFASMAILTKGSGMFLGMVPPLALLFSGKWRLLKRPGFWAAAIIVFVLCFPWTWKFRDVARAGWMEGNPSINFTAKALVFYPKKLLVSTGIGLMALAVVGLAARALVARRKSSTIVEDASEEEHYGCVFGAALLALLLFHSIIPAGLEDRHLVPALPLVIFFAWGGWKWLGEFFERKGVALAPVVLLVVAVCAFVLQTFRVPAKGYQGFAPAAKQLLAEPGNDKATFLVSSDARGEGMFISELAMREKRPGHVVQRGSKVLASSTWSGGKYRMVYRRKGPDGTFGEQEYNTEEQLADLLRGDAYDLLVLDTSLPDHYRKPHHEILQRTAEQFPAIFTRVAELKIQRENVWTNGIHIYRIKRD